MIYLDEPPPGACVNGSDILATCEVLVSGNRCVSLRHVQIGSGDTRLLAAYLASKAVNEWLSEKEKAS